MLRNRMSLAVSAAIATGVLLAHTAPAHAQARTGVTFLGGSGGQALGLNDLGQVTGYSYLPDGVTYRAFLYADGGLQDAGVGDSSIGQAINSRGHIVGYALRPDGAQWGFVRSNGSTRVLPSLGGQGGHAHAINHSGQVVGGSFLTFNSDYHAFSYSDGAIRDLGTLGGSYSLALGVNASGQIVGESHNALFAMRAFVYANGSMQDLGTLGGNFSTASAINARGQIVGRSSLSNGEDRAFLYENGNMVNLGTLGGSLSAAWGLNDTGQVVGQSRLSSGALVPFLWNAGAMYRLDNVAAGWTLQNVSEINNRGQMSADGFDQLGNSGGVLVTPHPDWQGGNGSWSDASRWSYGGLGAFGFTPAEPHNVVIAPTGSATILGPADATVNELRIVGNPGQIVTFDLNGGSTATRTGTYVLNNSVLTGNGRLSGDVAVQQGARINVTGGQTMQLTGGAVNNSGVVRVLGSATNPAGLEVAGAMVNTTLGQIHLQNANVSFLGGLTNANQMNVTFGLSTVAGAINNVAGGSLIVSNGAQVSFFDAIVNNGELRVSAGGAANFLGPVSGAGAFTGTGESRFEGGFAPGNSPALVNVSHAATFGADSAIEMELGGTAPGSGHDKLVFSNMVTLEGGALDVLWYGGWTGAANDVYDLFDWHGGLSGAFGLLNLPTLASGLSWNTSNLYLTGELSIAGPVPEPETYALLLAGLGLLGFAARRKKARSEVTHT
jgi:probable HAF family extracellular repeat protein